MLKNILFVTALSILVIINCFFVRQVFFGQSNLIETAESQTILVQPTTQLKSQFQGQFKYLGNLKKVISSNPKNISQLDNDQSLNVLIESPVILNIGKTSQLKAKIDYFGNDIQNKVLTSPPFQKGDVQRTEGLISSSNNQASLKPKINFDEYWLSSGVQAKVIVESKLQTLDECNLQCFFVQTTSVMRSRISYELDTKICRNYNDINNLFGQKCQQTLAWSYGLVVGNGDLFDSSAKKNLQYLGLTHLIVVSGSHIGLVSELITGITTKLKIRKKSRFWIIILGVITLIGIVGPQPPVLRSAIAIILSMFVTTFLGRKVNSLLYLIYSGLILLMINPWLLWSFSFWLSVMASLGISVFNKIFIIKKMDEDEVAEIQFWKGFKELFWSCVGSFVFTLPLVIILSGKVSILGVLTNLIVVPQIALLSILNFLGIIPIIGDIAIILAQVWQNIIIILLNLIVNSSFVQSLNLVWNVGEISILEIVVYYLILTVILVMLKFKASLNSKDDLDNPPKKI